MTNQLLERAITRHDIDFSSLPPEHFREAFDTLLPQLRAHHEYVATEAPLTFDALLETDDVTRQFSRVAGLLDHLTSVAETPELRAVYAEYMPRIASVQQELQLDESLPERVKQYLLTEEAQALNPVRAKVLREVLRAYEREGVYLDPLTKKKLAQLQERATTLAQQFECNLSDFNDAAILTFSRDELKGLPARSLENTTVLGDGQHEVTRVSGVFDDILAFCEVESTRKAVYELEMKEGVSAPWDNRGFLVEIVNVAQERARLLGYASFAAYATEKSMAGSPAEALAFETGLATRSLPKAREESAALTQFGTQLLGRVPDFHDYAFVYEKMRQAEFSLDSEALRKYFPVRSVVDGLFSMLEQLYDISFNHNTERSVWHEDATVYDVVDKSGGRILGVLYMDLFKRKNKSGGAWMVPAQTRHVCGDETYLPVVYIACNAPKDKAQEPTLDFSEVLTLFHEMGHALHNLLTEVDEEFFSGLNHVQHDAIELPSQFMENFCWDYAILKMLTRHVDTGDPLPASEFEKLKASRLFMAASSVLRTARYSMMDLLIYSNPGSDPFAIETQILETWKTGTRNPNHPCLATFSHIFADEYAAGYYAYQWAEMLSADAFAALKEEGSSFLEQMQAALRFRKHVLAVGGLEGMAENFKAFRGREPDLIHLLRDYAIA